MAGVALSVEGIEALIVRLGAAEAGLIKATAAALYREANAIFNASQRLVPVDTGVLKGSGQVTLPEFSGGAVEVTIGYGGPAAPYAIYVHEITTAYHEPPWQAKFLEQPFMEAANGMTERLGAEVALGFKL